MRTISRMGLICMGSTLALGLPVLGQEEKPVSLDLEGLRPGEPVVVRGMGLAFIDLVVVVGFNDAASNTSGSAPYSFRHASTNARGLRVICDLSPAFQLPPCGGRARPYAPGRRRPARADPPPRGSARS